MRRNWGKSIFVLSIFITSNCVPPPPEFVSFGAPNYKALPIENIKVYENRLDIETKFIEIGVMILNKDYYSKFMPEIKIKAASKGANGIIIEGNNAVFLKVFHKNESEEEIDEDSI